MECSGQQRHSAKQNQPDRCCKTGGSQVPEDTAVYCTYSDGEFYEPGYLLNESPRVSKGRAGTLGCSLPV